MTKIILILAIIIGSILRLYSLTDLPALNADEAAIGYNAYSLLQTGKDEHGNSWPIHFQSFNDYKPGLYFYIVMPFIKIIGMNELAIRLPGAFFGIATIIIVYFLSKQIFEKNKYLPVLSAFLLAISPWHIHFSRGGWEVNVATFFISAGVLFLMKGFKNHRFLYLSVVLFVCSLYTYHAARVIVPLFVISYLLINLNSLKEKLYSYIPLVIFALILIIPLAIDMVGPKGLSRASGVGIFADTGPYWLTNEQRGEHIESSLFLGKLLHNKFINYSVAFFDNYFSHFSGDFLFISGDTIQRNRVPDFGQLYLVDLLFLILGTIYVLKNLKNGYVLILWLILAPFASALTFQSPHALRAQNMVIPLVIIISAGLVFSFKYLRQLTNQKIATIFVCVFCAAYIWDFSRYLHQYYFHMAKSYPFSSQYGSREAMSFVEANKDKYSKIYITDRYDQPYILYLFYSKYPPKKFQENHNLTQPDQYGFSTVRQIDNLEFVSIKWDEMRDERGVLLIGTSEEFPIDAHVTHKINFPNGKPAYNLVPL